MGTMIGAPRQIYQVHTEVSCWTCLMCGMSVCAMYHIFDNRYSCSYCSCNAYRGGYVSP